MGGGEKEGEKGERKKGERGLLPLSSFFPFSSSFSPLPIRLSPRERVRLEASPPRAANVLHFEVYCQHTESGLGFVTNASQKKLSI